MLNGRVIRRRSVARHEAPRCRLTALALHSQIRDAFEAPQEKAVAPRLQAPRFLWVHHPQIVHELAVGILQFKWYINEIAGLFLALGVVAAVAGRLSGEEASRAFTEGAKDMIGAALIIGCARAILLVAMDGRILDTMLHAMEGAIASFHPVISAQLMFVSQCVINFFVHSGTAQAALTMPIMAPLGDLVGITRQTSVYAFQLAEYINPILPTSGVTMGVLGLARLRWEVWARWFLPLMLIWVVFGLLSLIPAVLLRWGPF